MKDLPVLEDDSELFDGSICSPMMLYFMRHYDTFHRMFYEQGKPFWQKFLIKFRVHATKYGYIHKFKEEKRLMDDIFDEAFIYLHEQIVDGTPATTKAVVCNATTVFMNADKLLACENHRKIPMSKNPFYVNGTREAFRSLFGQPSQTTYSKALILLPLYSRFGASVCIVLRRWIEAVHLGCDPNSLDLVKYQEFDRICADCLLLTVTKYCQEMVRGSPLGPRSVADYWNRGNPRTEDPNNPLYDKSAVSTSDWRNKLTITDWAMFVQYLREAQCPCYTTLVGLIIGPSYVEEQSNQMYRYRMLCTDAYTDVISDDPQQKLINKINLNRLKMLHIFKTNATYEFCYIVLPQTHVPFIEPLKRCDRNFTVTEKLISEKFYGLTSDHVQLSRGLCQQYSRDASSRVHYMSARFGHDVGRGQDEEPLRVRITCADDSRLDWLMLCVVNHVYKFNIMENTEVGIMDTISWIHLLTPDMWTNTCVRIQRGISTEKALFDGDLLTNWSQFDSLDPYLQFEEPNLEYLDLKTIDMTLLLSFLMGRGFIIPHGVSYLDFCINDGSVCQRCCLDINNSDHLLRKGNIQRSEENNSFAGAKTKYCTCGVTEGMRAVHVGADNGKNETPMKASKSDDCGGAIKKIVKNMNGNGVNVTESMVKKNDKGGKYDGSRVTRQCNVNIQTDVKGKMVDITCQMDLITENSATQNLRTGLMKVITFGTSTNNKVEAMAELDWSGDKRTGENGDGYDYSLVGSANEVGGVQGGNNEVAGFVDDAGDCVIVRESNGKKVMERIAVAQHIKTGALSGCKFFNVEIGTSGRGKKLNKGGKENIRVGKTGNRDRENISIERGNVQGIGNGGKVDSKVGGKGLTASGGVRNEASAKRNGKKSRVGEEGKATSSERVVGFSNVKADVRVSGVEKPIATKYVCGDVKAGVKKKGAQDEGKKGPKTCNHCGMEEVTQYAFKKCQKCKESGATNVKYYCGRECQILDWKAGHCNDH